ncbi:MAG: hypothetical protein AAF569_01740 [Pseudomonadota bacterium]
MLKFIAVCITLTFVFILTIPVLQVAALFGNSNGPTEIALQTEQQDNIDPFAVFENNEPSADALNAIEPAAGNDDVEIEEGFGSLFYKQEHPGFTDHIENIEETTEIDL